MLAGLDLHGHISAAQLAELKLCGLPSVKRLINRRAVREGWRFIDRVGKGGGRLYAIADLPEEARRDLIARRASALTDVRPRGRPKGVDFFALNPEVADYVVVRLSQARLPAATIHRELACHGEWPLPALRTLQRFVAQLEAERKTVFASIRDPDAFKSKWRVSLGRANGGVSFANEVWELDTTKADVMTIGGRKMVLGLIDRFSRRANFMVADSESGQAVRRFLIETIVAWGAMPVSIMTDNGSGYINQSIRTACEALGIEHRICPPGSPDKKPYIERLFRTFNSQVAEVLPGYVGHNVAQAQQLRGKARKDSGRAEIVPTLTAQELEATCAAWADLYNNRYHSAVRMHPLGKWHSCQVPKIAAPSEAVLKFALSALVGQRTVGKRGVNWRGGRYWSASLAPWVGRTVIVRRDEAELGELLIFAPDHSFIDVAVDHTRTGVSEEDFAREARMQQAQYLKEQRAAINAAARKIDIAALRDASLRQKAEDEGKLVYLQPATVTASTPAIDSLAEAFAGTASTPAQPTGEPKSGVVVAMPARPKPAEQKMREADDIIARAEAGEPVDAEQLRRAQLYRTTSEYRAQAALHAT